MNRIIRQTVLEYLGNKTGIESIVTLFGDASYRTYFRVVLESGGSLIVMKLPEGLSSASEEITNYKGEKEELPYINVSNYLKESGVLVSEIFHYNPKSQILILEDLGNELLFKKVDGASHEEKLNWYKEAIDLLCELKRLNNKKKSCIAFKRSFDAELLNWEFDHFLEYGIEARLNLKTEKEIKDKFIKITRKMTDEIIGMDYLFTHRDYQSRNIMIKNNKLYLIDFQDALLGPEAYDLVSLLRDSYVEMPDELLEKLINYYCKKRGLDISGFRRAFDLVTIQRKLKDAGRFVYIDRVKGNPGYLKHIPRSLACVKQALERRKNYKELYTVLKPFVREWAGE